MSDPLILRVRIATAAEMGFLGQAFGASFVQPLVKDQTAGRRSSVVALYGAMDAGKSTFAKEAIRFVPAFYHSFRTSRYKDQCVGLEFMTDDGLFRWKDFGRYTYEWGNRFRAIDNRSVFISRSSDASFRASSSGLDILEHPPALYLRDASVVVLFGTQGRVRETNKYFALTRSEHKVRVSEAFGNTIALHHSSAYGGVIVNEMWKLKAIVSRPVDCVHKEFHALSLLKRPWFEIAKAVIPQALRFLTCKRSVREERYVTFILTTENPQARQAFQNFQKKLLPARLVC